MSITLACLCSTSGLVTPKLGEPQEEFAYICGLDRTYIGGIERGERNVALVNIEKIAKALKISLPELFRLV